MSIRIDWINLKRNGPLETDLEFDPGDINLIHGANETGKTYIVESLIRLIFRTGKRWQLRQWDLSGKVLVSGLEKEPVPFTKTSRKKLDDYWEEEETGLPKELSRLLVVKAGETILDNGQGTEDGVGRDMLKDCLSGERLLDRITERIPKTLRKTIVEGGQIIGPDQGEIKNRGNLKSDLDRIDSILTEAEESYASCAIHSLRQEMKEVEYEIAALRKAKRHSAAVISREIRNLQDDLARLPGEEELNELESEIRLYEQHGEGLRRQSERLKKLESTSDNYRWAENALLNYQEISGLPAYGARSILVWTSLAALTTAVVLSFFGFETPSMLFAAASAVLFLVYYLGTKAALSVAGKSKELQRLQEEFEQRFGFQLADRATLQTQLDKLKEDHILATDLKKEISKLTQHLDSQGAGIAGRVRELTGTEVSPEEWREAIRESRRRIRRLQEEIRPVELRLASLAVPETDYLFEDPGVSWNSEHFDFLINQQDRIQSKLSDEIRNLENSRARLIQETGSANAGWEDLITALRAKREKTALDYKTVTGEILAKVLLHQALEEFREQEDKRISDGLGRDELTIPLFSLTRRYQKIRHQKETGLVVITDDHEEFPLAALSTGAREQTFMALRIGFASIAMEGRTAFLILDDAFQHSDWQRRVNLVSQSFDLARIGWQIFYFTMDDHIRDLFLEMGRGFDCGFQSLQL